MKYVTGMCLWDIHVVLIYTDLTYDIFTSRQRKSDTLSVGTIL